MLKVFVYNEAPSEIAALCVQMVESTEGVCLSESPGAADVAIAPLLTRKLSKDELTAPRLGVLVFHPSILPVHRGRDAIKWAFKLGERYSGATWFWADEGYDTGDICEQEAFLITPEESPRAFYARAVVPAGVRMLRFVLEDLKAGVVRRRPQIAEHASYEPPFKVVT